MQKLIEDLKKRQIIKDISKEDKINLFDHTTGVYTGFDPTATSLHLGNYIHIVNLLRFQRAGFNAIAVLGGATGMVGDPSFRESEREEMDLSTLEFNKAKIKKQLESFGLKVIDNYEFYKDLKFLDFLKYNGKLVNVSYMLAKDSVKQRLKNGMTFTEFSYQLIQGFDFNLLYEKHNVCIQLGGSDQWGNITTGLEIIKTLHGEDHKAIGITCNLLTDSNGNKIGKSFGGGSLWLDREQTSPYSMYQYLVNQRDEDVEKLLKWLTFVSLEEIEQIMKKSNADKRQRYAQKVLAFETIKIVHGEKTAKQCEEISQKLFANDILNLSDDDFELLKGFLPVFEYQDESVIDFVVNNSILSSRREFNEFLNNKALSFNAEVITDSQSKLDFDKFDGKKGLLKRGKRDFYIVFKK
ncbi:tyrosine--tRNA ligase [Mycoplasma sp. 4044]